MRRYVREATRFSPIDTFQGHGQTRSSDSKGLGTSYLSADGFPYADDGDPVDDGEEDEESESLDAPNRKMGDHFYAAHDPVGSWDGADRASISNMKHGVLERSGIVPLPGLYAGIDAGSPVGGVGTRVDQSPWTGSSRAAAGYVPLANDDDISEFDIDTIVNDDDYRSIIKSKMNHDRLVKEYISLCGD